MLKHWSVRLLNVGFLCFYKHGDNLDEGYVFNTSTTWSPPVLVLLPVMSRLALGLGSIGITLEPILKWHWISLNIQTYWLSMSVQNLDVHQRQRCVENDFMPLCVYQQGICWKSSHSSDPTYLFRGMADDKMYVIHYQLITEIFFTRFDLASTEWTHRFKVCLQSASKHEEEGQEQHTVTISLST